MYGTNTDTDTDTCFCNSITLVGGNGIQVDNATAKSFLYKTKNTWENTLLRWEFWKRYWRIWRIMSPTWMSLQWLISGRMAIPLSTESKTYHRKKGNRRWCTKIAVIGAFLVFLIHGMRFCMWSFYWKIIRININKKNHR